MTLFESQMEEYHRREMLCETKEQREGLCREVISFFEATLAEFKEACYNVVYYAACGWLAKSDLFWHWIVYRAAQAGVREHLSLSTGIFTTLAEPPTDRAWRDKLLNLLSHKQHWRDVAEAYSGLPEKLIRDLNESWNESYGDR